MPPEYTESIFDWLAKNLEVWYRTILTENSGKAARVPPIFRPRSLASIFPVVIILQMVRIQVSPAWIEDMRFSDREHNTLPDDQPGAGKFTTGEATCWRATDGVEVGVELHNVTIRRPSPRPSVPFWKSITRTLLLRATWMRPTNQPFAWLTMCLEEIENLIL
jgi:hypothetical protein